MRNRHLQKEAQRRWYRDNRSKVKHRSRRWKKRHKKRARAIGRKANRRYAEKRAAAPRRRIPEATAQENLSVLSRPQLGKPNLTWMDTNGELHAERELSAEELIRNWQKKQGRKT
jgi:hypothetical protein